MDSKKPEKIKLDALRLALITAESIGTAASSTSSTPYSNSSMHIGENKNRNKNKKNNNSNSNSGTNSTQTQPNTKYSRCGRTGHNSNSCFAKTHSNGSRLTSKPPAEPSVNQNNSNKKENNNSGKNSTFTFESVNNVSPADPSKDWTWIQNVLVM